MPVNNNPPASLPNHTLTINGEEVRLDYSKLNLARYAELNALDVVVKAATELAMIEVLKSYTLQTVSLVGLGRKYHDYAPFLLVYDTYAKLLFGKGGWSFKTAKKIVFEGHMPGKIHPKYHEWVRTIATHHVKYKLNKYEKMAKNYLRIVKQQQ